MFDVKKLSAIHVGLASPETIRSWSHGEVKKPETINYRSQKPEMEGLYCEKIFGPAKDYECHCGKYKKIRFKGTVCEKCGVEVTSRQVRRERMGHIELASPCTHIWYLKGIPSRIGLLLDVSPKHLEEVVYFAGHFCLNDLIDPSLTKKDKNNNEVKTYLLKKCDFIDEKNGKEKLLPVLRFIKKNVQLSDYEMSYCEDLISKLEDPSSIFDFLTVSGFISAHTNVEFSEGAEAIKKLLQGINLDDEIEKVNKDLESHKNKSDELKYVKRLECLEAFKNGSNKPEWMVLDVIPVIPPDLRPMLQLDGGRFATSDLNDLYRRVISRNNRLQKLVDMNAPQVILMNEKRMLQEAVDALIDNGRRNKPVQGTGGRPLKSLSSSLKGKTGRFRLNLLGKRVDYSGRSVIAVGPSLKMYQCGLPREMAVQLLRPFIACELMKAGVANGHKQADKIIDRYDSVVLDIIEKIISKHPVLLNRAPTLHRLGIQAFQPILVEGRAIRLHPLVCPGFNADFDGDQMAVHVPLSKAAQEEALRLMLASNNILYPKDGKPIVTPGQDMVLGNYYLTLEFSKEDFLKNSKKLAEQGDDEEANRYKVYAASEGKVFKSVDDVLKAYETKQISLHNRIAILGKALLKTSFSEEMNNGYLLTSVGKLIFNLIFPEDFPYLNVVSQTSLNSETANEYLKEFIVPKGTNILETIASRKLLKPFNKKDLGKIINEIVRKYGTSKTSAVLDKLKDQGFKYSTVSGVTISLFDINVVEGKAKLIKEGDDKVREITDMFEDGLLTDEERHKHIIDVWSDILKKVTDNFKVQFQKDPHNPLYMMGDSGARGNTSNFTQLAGMRGLMGNTSGGTIELPVKNCFREGLSISEFFISTHGARKGGSDTALRTADSGYLTRRLVDVSQDVIIREIDCHTDHGSEVYEIRDTARDSVIVKLYDRLVGRYALNDVIHPETSDVIVKGNTMIDEEKAAQIVDAGITSVWIRSIFGCESKDGVCAHCYGRNLATGKEVAIGEAVGIMAAQSIGEPGTQLTMRTFHTGGVAGSDITQGLPRVQELFEARNPKGKAVIAKISGTISKIDSKDGVYTVWVKKGEEEKEHKTDYGVKLRVRLGDNVQAGDKITEGAIAPRELLSYAGIVKVQKYILKEVQKVYSAQGIEISDKHIEIIVRQMLRKVIVKDSGDTPLIHDTHVSLTQFTDESNKALLEGKRPATFEPLLLGITKAALETDSFLSAASFQETTRVLTDAAIKGKIDYLHGLKENVITGKLIPAGRGILNPEEAESMIYDFDVLDHMKKVKDQYIEAHDRTIQEIAEKIDESSNSNTFLEDNVER